MKAKRQKLPDISSLSDMNLSALRQAWAVDYGDAPTHRSADLLRRVLAWRLQADNHGGLDSSTQQRLNKDGPLLLTPQSGMRLARIWEGQRHEVVILHDGLVLYEGRQFNSLSQVARHITGQRWNGPRFFGLRQENKR